MLAALWLACSALQSHQHSDGIMLVLTSLQRWTPFYWQQDRFGMLVPLLALPIQAPFWNLIVESSLTALAGFASVFFAVRYPPSCPRRAKEAKRFDLLVLNLQLALLRSEPAFARLRDQVKEIAGLLEEKAAIPMVREQMALIQDAQTDEWWQDVTVPMLEALRRRLRELVKLIEKQKRKPIFTDFRMRWAAKERSNCQASANAPTSPGSERRPRRSCGRTRTTSPFGSSGRTGR